MVGLAHGRVCTVLVNIFAEIQAGTWRQFIVAVQLDFHLLVALFQHVLPEVARFRTRFVALYFFQKVLAEHALLGRTVLIVDVSLYHLFLKLAPLTEFLAATICVKILHMSHWTNVIFVTLVELS